MTLERNWSDTPGIVNTPRKVNQRIRNLLCPKREDEMRDALITKERRFAVACRIKPSRGISFVGDNYLRSVKSLTYKTVNNGANRPIRIEIVRFLGYDWSAPRIGTRNLNICE